MHFLADGIQLLFDQQGFAQIPLLSGEELNRVLDIYNEWHGHEPETMRNGIFTTIFLPDNQTKVAVHTGLASILNDKLDSTLTQYCNFCSAFIVKISLPESHKRIHQDINLVDPHFANELRLWLPLTDIEVDNGTFYAIPGSHKWFTEPRAPGLPERILSIQDQLSEHLVPLYPKAGTGIFFDPALIHYVGPNTSGKTRLTSFSMIIPKQNDAVQFHMGDNGRIDVYQVAEDYFFSFADFERECVNKPNGKWLRDYPAELLKPATEEELSSILKVAK